MGIRDN